MEIANCSLWLTNSHQIFKKHITPAEYLLLTKMHGANNGKVEDVQLVGDVKRNSASELERLLKRYRADWVNGKEGLFPGVSAQVPMTFAEIGVETTPYVAPEGVEPITKYPIGQDTIEATEEIS